MIAIAISLAIFRPGIARIEIVGNKYYSDKEIQRAVDFNSPADSIISGVLGLYREAGYFGAGVELERSGDGQAALKVNEGAPTVIDNISVEILPDSLAIFDDLIAGMIQKTASQELMNQFARAALSRLAERGMPFARGEWIDFDIVEENELKAIFKIVPGPVCIVRDFIFEGISRTRPGTITKVLNIRNGELYSESSIRQSEKRIDQSAYLDVVSPLEIEINRGGDSCRIIYHLKELPSTRIDGAGGYVRTRNNSEFIGRVNMDFGDILGTGRAFGLKWSRKDRYSGELRLNYLEPFIFGSRFNLLLEAFQVDRDSLYLESGGNLGFEYQLGGGTKARAAFGLRRVEPESAGRLTSSTSRSVGLALAYDGTDYPTNPKRGYAVGTGIDYSYRTNRIVIEGDVPPTTITAIRFDGGWYGSILSGLVVALGVRGWGIVNIDGNAPVDELRFIGGFDLLRGYSEQRFPAFRYGIGAAEIRLLTGKKSRAYLFGDFGAVKSSQIQNDKYRFHPGFGFGLLAPTTLGQFKVEIAWGESGFPTEPIINFGVAGSF